MRLLFDDDQEELRRSTAGLIRRRHAALGVRALMDSDTGVDMEAWRQGAQLGWFGMLVADDHGGGSLSGQGTVDTSGLAEVWGAHLVGGPLVSTVVVAVALSADGSAAQRALVPSIVAGEAMATWCVAEGGAEWDVAHPSVAAVRDGGGLVLTGTKLYVEGADLAAHLLVTATFEGVVVELLVPASAPGITLVAHRSLDLTRRLWSVQFDRTPLTLDSLLPGADLGAIGRRLDTAAALTCADSVGGMDAILTTTVAYTRDRVQFGRPIASFQAIKHRCADLLAVVEGARAASRYAALSLDRPAPDSGGAVDLAKAHVGEAYALVAGECIQLHGGTGFTWDHDMHLYARRAKVNEVLWGSPAWRRRRTSDRLRRLAASAVGG